MPSNASNAATPPRPSVFLSYASADRTAARTLRDTLASAGLDVWLDEDELGGGEAWDAKIRHLIRTCTYFMPVISATTEVRREGYFRREWRFAVERTLDLADDVMFLVPVVIDDTPDAGARVPEKFFSVQWLRVPGGEATPALRELAGKLATDEAVAVHAPTPTAAPVSASPDRKTREKEKVPAQFPAFPTFPERGQRTRFGYELILWVGRVLRSLWNFLPRFVRVIAAIIITFELISFVFHNRARDADDQNEKAAVLANVTKALGAATRAAAPSSDGDSDAADTATIESVVGAVADAVQAGRPLALVTFGGSGEDAATYANLAFRQVRELLPPEADKKVSVSPARLPDSSTDADALLRGARLKSRFVLTGQARREAPGQPLKFTVKLYDVKQTAPVWTETYDAAQVDAATAAQRVAAEVKQRALNLN